MTGWQIENIIRFVIGGKKPDNKFYSYSLCDKAAWKPVP